MALGEGVRASLREPASAFELAPTLGAATSAGREAGDAVEPASSLVPTVGGDSIGNAATGIEGPRDTREASMVDSFTVWTGRNATRAGADVGSAGGDGFETDAGSKPTIALGPGMGGAGRTANEAGCCVEARPDAGAAT